MDLITKIHSHRQLHPATSNIDVDRGLIPRALLQADVAAHVSRLSPRDVQRRHPIHLSLSPKLHVRPFLSQPLHLLLALTAQFQWFVDVNDKVVLLSGGDSWLGVAYKGIKRIFNCMANMKIMISQFVFKLKCSPI